MKSRKSILVKLSIQEIKYQLGTTNDSLDN